jgi:hypothetical protein
VSPITTLTLQSQGKPINVVYTQTFPAVNDQWPAPSSGAIGLGTIQGEVGVPKTQSKRSEPMTVLAEPTGLPHVSSDDVAEEEQEQETTPVLETRSRRGRMDRGRAG